jgi:hypothetical protein
MSSNREDVQLVLDNRCNIAKASHALVRVSGNNINYFETPADTPGNYDSIITFNSIITPSLASTLISRNPRIRYTVTITVDETAGTAFPAVGYFPVFADVVANSQYKANTVLRAFPLQSICGTLSTTINGATTTINSRMLLDLVQRKLTKNFVDNQASECPAQPDNMAGLLLDSNAPVLTINGTTGTIVSPLVAGSNTAYNFNSHADQVLSKYENSNGANRGSFRPISIAPSYQATAPGASNARVIVFEVSEPILQSPFTQHDNEAFLCNINTMSMIWNLQQKNDMLVSALNSVGSGGYDPACLTSLNIAEARLEWTYIQVPKDLVTIPAVASYPYDNLVYFNKTYTGVAVGNNMSGIQTDTIRFNCQPDLIMVAARLPRANRSGATAGDTAKADIFFGMGQWAQGPTLAGISVNYGVKNGLLSGCSSKTLFRISKRNGWKGSWNDWVNGQAVLFLNPALDLGLDLGAGDALPMENAANQNFQINLTLNAQPFNFAGVALGANTDVEVIVAPVYKGIVNITPNNALFNLGELSHGEVMQALAVQPKSGAMVTDEHVAPTIQGAGLFSSLKSIVGRTADALQSDLGQKALSMGMEYAKKKFMK